MSPATTASTRWCPTPEQLMILEEMYRGGVRTPSATQIQQITGHLSRYGKIEGKNVFYWFQNHKARDRQKLRRRLAKQLMLQQQQQQERGRDYCSSFREQHKNEQQQLVQQQQQQQQTYGFQQQPSSHLLQFHEPRCYDHHNYGVAAAASSGSTLGFQQYHICHCTKSAAAGCLPDQNGQSSTLNEMINCLKKVEIPGYIGTRNLQTDKAQKSTAADTAKNYGHRDRDNWPVITSTDVVGSTRPPKTLDLFPISTPSSTNVNYIR